MPTNPDSFKEKYGPWALVAGATEGIGEAFSTALAKKGINIVLVARRPELLTRLSHELEKKFLVETRTIQLDLADPDMLSKITEHTADLFISMLVYNAVYSTIGSFFRFSLEDQQKIIDVNCRGPVLLTHHFGGKMKAQNRGGIILMSSLAAFQGSPIHTHYAATKAFNLTLAEGLWYELKQHGVDVLACCAGATSTPNFLATNPKDIGPLAPKPLAPETVAGEALDAIGKKHLVIPGRPYRISNLLMTRLMPRKKAVTIMGDTAVKMYGY